MTDSLQSIAEAEVRTKEDEFYLALRDAFTNQNGGRLDSILAPDYVSTDDAGNVIGKEDLKKECTDGSYTFTTFTIVEPMNIRLYNNCATAIVTCRDRLEGAIRRKPVRGLRVCNLSGEYQWTDVWVKETGGEWRCVASHDSRIP
jgi:hypothetical protein